MGFNGGGLTRRGGGAAIVDKLFKITINTAGSFTLPFQSAATNVTVYWGDGLSDVITSYNQSELTHTYASAGVYQISVDGQFGGVRFNNGGNRLEVTSIDNWGSTVWNFTNQSFWGCSNMTSNYSDKPKFLISTNMLRMFRGCTDFNGNVSDWNVSKITNMQEVFIYCSTFNRDILNWNTLKVTSMSFMFYNSFNFNGNISGFNISSLTNASNMLNGTSFDTTNYDLLLISWAAQTHNNNVPFHAGTAQYSPGAAANARAVLIADGWTITDGGQV